MEVLTNPCSDVSARPLHAAFDALRHMRRHSGRLEDIAAIRSALKDKDPAEGLAAALAHVVGHEPQLVELLRDAVIADLQRTSGNLFRGWCVVGA